MRTALPDKPKKFYSLRQTAWILGVTESEVCRLVPTGVLPVIRRRFGLVVHAPALAHLMPTPDEGMAP